MAKTYLWQDPAFPHFYSNPAVVAPLETSFRQAVTELDADMKIVSGTRIDREQSVIHEGVSKTQVHDKMTEFIEWYNACSSKTPLLNAIQGHIHYNRVIDYELRGGFEGGMNNTKYQKMTAIGDRTALRDLSQLHERGLMVKIGELKGTRYYLNIPHILERL